MTEPRTIVSIDIGTTKICTLVAEANENTSLRIIGVGVSASRGMRKGVVVNVQEATEAIASSVAKAERLSGCKVTSAYISIGGSHIQGVNSRGVVAISRSERGISQHDIDRALDAARAIAIPQSREILHTIPRGFVVDGQDGVRNPIGMQGIRLEVEAHIITASKSSVSNLARCVKEAGIEIDDIILQPLVSGEAVLTDAEREMGVVLADIGGGTTDLAFFLEGSIWHTVVLPTGGEFVTKDVAVGLRTPFATAEDLKIQYGHAQTSSILTDETIEVMSFGDEPRQMISRLQLTDIIEARVEEIFRLVLRETKRLGYDGLLAAGVVLCGGTANLPGIKELGRDTLSLPVRVGKPHDLQGLTDVLEDPAYATAVGLLLWGQRHRPRSTSTGQPDFWRQLWQRLRQVVTIFLPE